MSFERLEPVGNDTIHAQGEWLVGGETRRVAVSFGPQYGPITAKQVEDVLWSASRRGYDDLVFAGFTIDGAAQATVQEDPNPRVRCHLAYIRPDVNIGGDLLKDTPSSQLFTVFGLPHVSLDETGDGEYVVTMEGVDIYDPHHQHHQRHPRRQGGGLVPGQRLRRRHLLHQPGILPRQQCLGEAGQGVEDRGRSGPLRGVLRYDARCLFRPASIGAVPSRSSIHAATK